MKVSLKTHMNLATHVFEMLMEAMAGLVENETDRILEGEHTPVEIMSYLGRSKKEYSDRSVDEATETAIEMVAYQPEIYIAEEWKETAPILKALSFLTIATKPNEDFEEEARLFIEENPTKASEKRKQRKLALLAS